MKTKKSANGKYLDEEKDYEEDQENETNQEDETNETKTNWKKEKKQYQEEEEDFDEEELEQLLVEYEDLKVSSLSTNATKGAKRMYSSISVSDE
jgi:hypothetical protein